MATPRIGFFCFPDSERGDGIAFSLIVEAAEAFAQQAVCALGQADLHRQ